MTKKESEQFKTDILAALKDQQEKIEQYKQDMEGIVRSSVSAVEQENRKPTESPVVCAIVVTAFGVISQQELELKAHEVAELIKPIMLKYDLAQIQARLKK